MLYAQLADVLAKGHIVIGICRRKSLGKEVGPFSHMGWT